MPAGLPPCRTSPAARGCHTQSPKSNLDLTSHPCALPSSLSPSSSCPRLLPRSQHLLHRGSRKQVPKIKCRCRPLLERRAWIRHKLGEDELRRLQSRRAPVTLQIGYRRFENSPCRRSSRQSGKGSDRCCRKCPHSQPLLTCHLTCNTDGDKKRLSNCPCWNHYSCHNCC